MALWSHGRVLRQDFEEIKVEAHDEVEIFREAFSGLRADSRIQGFFFKDSTRTLLQLSET